MRIDLSFFDLLIIIGMVTGIICSILIFKESKKKPSNKFLGLGILGFVWLNTKTLLLSLNLWEIHGFGYFPNGVELALSPLFYFYIVSLLQSDFKFTKKQLLHFIPFLISQTYAIVVYIAVMQTDILADKNLIANSFHFSEIKRIDDYLVPLSIMIYLYFGHKHIRNYKDWLSKNNSDTQLSELGFIENLFLGFLFVAFYIVINLILNQFLSDTQHRWRWQFIHLIIASLVYYMGLVGYKNSNLISLNFSIKAHKKTKKTSELIDLKLIAKLNNLIEKDKIYLNPKLSLQELTQILDVNENILSNTINAHYEKNFRNLINEFRVKEVEHRLLNEGLSNLSLLGLAKECGFNSEASFYRIFKTKTGLTPKQFLVANS